MTNTTLKALIDVYGTLIRAGWGDTEDERAERMVPGHETPAQPSQAEQSMEPSASNSPLGTQKREART
jgi:hypothetical protein